MTGITGLGGHNPQMQRALLELAEKATAEAELADGGVASARARPPGSPTAGSVRPESSVPGGEAVILELSDEVAERLAAAKDDPVTPQRDDVAPRGDNVSTQRDSVTPEPTRESNPGAPPRLEDLSVDQLVAVLRRSGTDFKQALRVLANIDLGQPLPSKHTLRAMWDGTAAQAEPVRAEEDHSAVVPDQVYVAGLTTAEYQQLLVQLGEQAPEWFTAVRASTGLRAVMERPWFARLNTHRFAGLRLGGWGLAGAGVAIAWVVGLRTGAWW